MTQAEILHRISTGEIVTFLTEYKIYVAIN